MTRTVPKYRADPFVSDMSEPGQVDETLLTTLPDADSITLLFKFSKQTVLLSVLPSQSFSEIKVMFFLALHSRNITTFSVTDPDDLELAVLKDKKDASKGWVLMEEKEKEMDGKAGKKKASAAAATGNCPEGIGLGDGGWVAVRAKRKSEEEDEEMEELEDPGWDVVLPSYEDEEGE